LPQIPDFAAIAEGADVVIPVYIRDRTGAEVVHADITVWVSAARKPVTDSS
jgi:hypothetical protein